MVNHYLGGIATTGRAETSLEASPANRTRYTRQVSTGVLSIPAQDVHNAHRCGEIEPIAIDS